MPQPMKLSNEKEFPKRGKKCKVKRKAKRKAKTRNKMKEMKEIIEGRENQNKPARKNHCLKN